MKKPDERGFTFLETLIVLSIMAVLTAGIGIPSIRYIDRAKQIAARTQMAAIRLALQEYYLDCDTWPTNEQGLSALTGKPELWPIPDAWAGPYLSSDPAHDPWGGTWYYRANGTATEGITLRCLGSDRAEGGTGYAADFE